MDGKEAMVVSRTLEGTLQVCLAHPYEHSRCVWHTRMHTRGVSSTKNLTCTRPQITGPGYFGGQIPNRSHSSVPDRSYASVPDSAKCALPPISRVFLPSIPPYSRNCQGEAM